MIQFNGEYYCDRIGHIPIHVRSVYILRHKSQGLGLVTIGLLHYFGDSIQVNVTLIVGKNWALQACEVVWRIFWWFITAWLHKSTLTDLSLRRFLLEYMCTHVKWECKVGLWRVFMIHHRLAPRKYSNRSHPTKIPDRINIPKKKRIHVRIHNHSCQMRMWARWAKNFWWFHRLAPPKKYFNKSHPTKAPVGTHMLSCQMRTNYLSGGDNLNFNLKFNWVHGRGFN